MIRTLLCAAGGAFVFVSLAAAQGNPASPVGRWATEGGKSHIEIYPCGQALCGRIVWLREPVKNGRPLTDRNNPDPAKRGQPILGLELMRSFVRGSDPGEWEGGRIYNPEDGEVYKAKMRLLVDGKLQVRGYVGIPLLGKSQHWVRVR